MLTHYTPYTNVALDAHIKNAIREAAAKVHIAAQTEGSTNQPPLAGGSVDILFHPHHLDYQMILDHINTVLQAEGTKFTVQENGEQTALETQRLNNVLADQKAKRIPIENRLAATPVPKKYYIRAALAAIAVLALADALFIRQVFEWWLGVSHIEALLFSLIFAAAFGIYAHTARYLIALGKTILQKRAIIIALSIATVLWFFYMGVARAAFMNAEEGSATHGPVPFTVLSTILMGVAVMIAWRNFPSKEDKEACDRYAVIKAEKDSIEAEIQATEQAITKLKEDNTSLRTSSAAIIEYGRMLEQQTIVAAEKAYYEMQTINIRYRSDGGQPDCFGKPYPFAFKQYFLFTNNQ